MKLEALQKGLITGGQPARKLKEQPEIIKLLHEYNQSVQQIPRLNIRVRTITSAVVRASEAIRMQEGLADKRFSNGRLDAKAGPHYYCNV